MEEAGPGHGKAPGSQAFREALASLARFLSATGHPSAIIGGVAVIARGFARLTVDIDATVLAGPEEVPALLRKARKFKLAPRVEDAESFARENLVLLLEHLPTKVPIDLTLGLQPFELEAAESAETVDFQGVEIRVPTLTSLLVYKMLAGRPQDLKDVAALLATQASFDLTKVEADLRSFDALLETDRLREFRKLLATRRR